MTIEISQPELQAMIQQRMETGRFESLEDMLADALRPTEPGLDAIQTSAKNMKEVWTRAGQLGVELDITRHPVADRPVEF